MSTTDNGRPNVVVVLTDQQRWDTVGAYGSPTNLTPNLDRMAAEGTLVEHAFTPQPVCGPARASLQTGQYATTHGVWMNGIPLPDTEHALARQFAARGYRTAYVGKWHLGGSVEKPVPAGRRGGYEDYWRAADVMELTSTTDEGLVYDGDGDPVWLEGNRTDALTDLAISFLERDHEEPFFLFLSLFEPHNDTLTNRFDAPDGYADRYKNPWVPPDLQGIPGDWYESLPDYYGNCAKIDECVGRLRRALRRSGLAGDTVVAFASDHGCHFRTRNKEHKRSCHEASIRVPMILDGPGFEDNTITDELVSLIDLPPTLLDAAGIHVPDAMGGMSLRPLLEADPPEWREEVYIEISEADVGRAIRTNRWKYGVTAPDLDGRDQARSDRYVERYLYDLAADPAERVNLVGRYDYRDVADRLRDQLRARIEPAHDAVVEIEPAPYTVH